MRTVLEIVLGWECYASGDSRHQLEILDRVEREGGCFGHAAELYTKRLRYWASAEHLSHLCLFGVLE